MMVGFIDTMRSERHAARSICRVLRGQGCQIAARTYRAWRGGAVAVVARTVTDAQVVDAVRDAAWRGVARRGRPSWMLQ
jgi:putative transposase